MDSLLVVVLVSALIQGWTLPAAARFLKLDEPEPQSPPVTLEISSLRDVDGDIVDYFVENGCLAAGQTLKELGLPEGVVVAMIAHNHKVIMPKGSFQIECGDHVVVVLRPAPREYVDRVFAFPAAS